MSDPDLEQRLRATLRSRAEQLTPQDRLESLRVQVGSAPATRARWVMFTAAASALIVAAGVWWAGQRRDPDLPVAPPTASATSSAPRPTPTASTTPMPSASAAPTDLVEDLTVYAVSDEVVGTPRGVLGLRRVVHPGAVPRAEVGLEAARLAVLGTDGSAAGWPRGVEVQSVTPSATEIAVVLAVGSPEADMTKESARLAIMAVVYSVQDALDSPLPVRFVTLDGSTTLLNPAWPVDRTYQRAAEGEEYLDLVDVLITQPTPVPVVENQYPSGASVLITGEATAFEAMVHWELTLKGTRVRSGDVMASEGAPGRGTFTLRLNGLADTRPGPPYELTLQTLGGESGTTVLSSDSTRFYVGPFNF